MKQDLIQVFDAPGNWDLDSKMRKIISLLKKGGLLSSSHQIILSVSVVGKKEMAALNKKFRKKNTPTDVLSFEHRRESKKNMPKGILFLGDLVLCAPVIQSQAKENRLSVSHEVSVVLTHGLLHLLGYDHEKSPKKAAEMALKEDKILKLLGVRKSGLVNRNTLITPNGKFDIRGRTSRRPKKRTR